MYGQMNMSFIKSFPLSILVTLTVAALSLLPIGRVEVAANVPLADKWTHMVMYAVLTAVICWERHRRQNAVSALPLIFAIVYGGVMELLQAYCTTYRSGEWLDFAADAIGAVLGFLLCLIHRHSCACHRRGN